MVNSFPAHMWVLNSPSGRAAGRRRTKTANGRLPRRKKAVPIWASNPSGTTPAVSASPRQRGRAVWFRCMLKMVGNGAHVAAAFMPDRHWGGGAPVSAGIAPRERRWNRKRRPQPPGCERRGLGNGRIFGFRVSSAGPWPCPGRRRCRWRRGRTGRPASASRGPGWWKCGRRSSRGDGPRRWRRR